MCGLTRSKQSVSISSEKYGEFILWLKIDCCGLLLKLNVITLSLISCEFLKLVVL
jgi:hypothetical protein